jgi:hypothetical protein
MHVHARLTQEQSQREQRVAIVIDDQDAQGL